MPDDLHMLLFDFNGGIEIPDSDQNAVSVLPSGVEIRHADETVSALNKQAEVISQKIEREIRRILPPTVTVQANIQFDEGSVVITGVVALLSWAAPIVGDAAKKELGELVKLAIKRVLSRYVPGYASLTELRVTPQSSTPTPPSPPSDTDRTSRAFAGDKISVTTALLVVTVLILILQVVTLLVHLR
jgi:hypothetical protein